MSSKRPKVHIKTEALSKPVAQLFNVLNFEDVPMPTTEFIPGPRASFGISAFLNANTASQDPDPFDFGTISSNMRLDTLLLPTFTSSNDVEAGKMRPAPNRAASASFTSPYLRDSVSAPSP